MNDKQIGTSKVCMYPAMDLTIGESIQFVFNFDVLLPGILSKQIIQNTVSKLMVAVSPNNQGLARNAALIDTIHR